MCHLKLRFLTSACENRYKWWWCRAPEPRWTDSDNRPLVFVTLSWIMCTLLVINCPRLERNPLNSTFSSEWLMLKSLQTSFDQRHSTHTLVLISHSPHLTQENRFGAQIIKWSIAYSIDFYYIFCRPAKSRAPGVNVPCLGYAVEVMLQKKRIFLFSFLEWSERGDGRDRLKRGRWRGLDLKSVIPFH